MYEATTKDKAKWSFQVPPEPPAESEIVETVECDTVVVGGGIGGFSAACRLRELGADVIIDGGQTANPSAEDFVDAIGQLDCDHVLLLPNNGNILLTAQQAAKLCPDVDVHVVPTKSFPQGYAALAVFNSELDDVDEQVEYMTEAKSAVVSGEITYAIRDTVIGDVAVKKDEAIGILDGKLVCSCADEQEAMCAMLAEIEDIEDREILTLFVGADVTEEERVAMSEAIEQAYEDLTVETFVGGQQVYRFLVAVE